MDVDHRLFLLSFFFLFFFLSLREYRLPFEQDLNCQVPIFQLPSYRVLPRNHHVLPQCDFALTRCSFMDHSLTPAEEEESL